MAGILALGFLAQHGGSGGAGGQLAGHGKAMPIYLSTLFMDWALLYYCWAACIAAAATLKRSRAGAGHRGRIYLWIWPSHCRSGSCGKCVANGTHWLLGPSSAKTVNSLLPQSLLEVLIWIGLSITAGICEEMAFRGYLQQQLHALGGGVVAAVAGAGADIRPGAQLSGLEECDRDLRAWSSVWSAGSMAQESARKHRRRTPGATFGEAG